MILRHGTTRGRAERILQQGPDPSFQAPDGQACSDGFSMCLEGGPFLFGMPEAYTRSKAAAFPGEGGPAILVVEVPDDLVTRAIYEWFPLSEVLVQFDLGAGLEELMAAWSTLEKQILDILDK